MDKRKFDELINARSGNRPVVLIKNLLNGKQELYYPDQKGGAQVMDEQLLSGIMESFRSDCSQLLETDNGQVFIQVFQAPLRMILVGAVHISQHLIPIASSCDYQVILIDPRQAFADAERFPGIDVITAWPDEALQRLDPDRRSAIITLTHDPKLDDPALETALASEAFYIGALGSRKSHTARVERLLEKGFSHEQLDRIHAPVGLDIHARSPAEIAVSIMGEITLKLHGG